MRQGQMTNAEYLEKFKKTTSRTFIASSYGGEILDPAVLEYCRLKLHPGMVIANQNVAEMVIVHQTAKELCLGTAFILQWSATGVATESYSKNKQWRPASAAPQSEGVVFAQKSKQDNSGKDCGRPTRLAILMR
jgi:hypothetical protein